MTEPIVVSGAMKSPRYITVSSVVTPVPFGNI